MSPAELPGTTLFVAHSGGGGIGGRRSRAPNLTSMAQEVTWRLHRRFEPPTQTKTIKPRDFFLWQPLKNILLETKANEIILMILHFLHLMF